METRIYYIWDKIDEKYIDYNGKDDWYFSVTPDGKVYCINTVGQLFEDVNNRFELEMESYE